MRYADREWFYTYRLLHSAIDESRLLSRSTKISQQYDKLTKSWSASINSEWTCRLYFASKMILNATALSLSHAYATSTGLNAATSFLAYYAHLSLCRGLVATLPHMQWEKGRLIEITHAAAIARTIEHVAALSPHHGAMLKEALLKLKADRELVAYRAPASGPPDPISSEDGIKLMTLLAEVIQSNTELLEQSVSKHTSPDTHTVSAEDTRVISHITLEGREYRDMEDMGRLDYLRRKIRRPYSIAKMITEGQAEEFMWAWQKDDPAPGTFSAESPIEWQVLFDIP